jgi:HlyD family secretion protein
MMEGTQSSIRRHLTAIFAAAFLMLGSIGLLGAGTLLSGAVVAGGSLVVESTVKKVQHPTGGGVGKLLVDDGARVEAGELLIRLDPVEAQANLAAVTKSLWELTARGARLEAERDASEQIAFAPGLLAAAADDEIGRIVTGESRLFELRRDAREGQKAQLTRDERNATSYYLVRIALEGDQIQRLKGLRLVPGMPVEAFIKTAERTMLSYLLKPLIDQAWRAFREN